MKSDVLRYARSCHLCQSLKPRGGKIPALLQPIKSQHAWSLAARDIIGPFSRSPKGHQYLLVVTDHFSKWVELFPLRTLTARVILDKLMEVFSRFRYPQALISDNASVFTLKVFVDICAALGIKHNRTTTYHPQSNVTERVNRNRLQLMQSGTRIGTLISPRLGLPSDPPSTDRRDSPLPCSHLGMSSGIPWTGFWPPTPGERRAASLC
ncbi:uncharacterized protein ISCGN_027194 [Ixodes scapularis]